MCTCCGDLPVCTCCGRKEETETFTCAPAVLEREKGDLHVCTCCGRKEKMETFLCAPAVEKKGDLHVCTCYSRKEKRSNEEISFLLFSPCPEMVAHQLSKWLHTGTLRAARITPLPVAVLEVVQRTLCLGVCQGDSVPEVAEGAPFRLLPRGDPCGSSYV